MTLEQRRAEWAILGVGAVRMLKDTMKTLKVKLHATTTNYLQYECLVEAPDDVDPEDFIHLLHEAVDGADFSQENAWCGDWHPDGGEWTVTPEGRHGPKLPLWRYVPDAEDTIQEVA